MAKTPKRSGKRASVSNASDMPAAKTEPVEGRHLEAAVAIVAEPAKKPAPATVSDHIVLRNTSSQEITINLTHEHYCRGSGECLCRWVRLNLSPQQVDGSKKFQETKVRRNASITILANGKSRPLHRAVLGLPGVESVVWAPNPGLVPISLKGG
jgi:hypothetical protein